MIVVIKAVERYLQKIKNLSCQQFKILYNLKISYVVATNSTEKSVPHNVITPLHNLLVQKFLFSGR